MNKNLRVRGIVIAVVTALCLVIMFGPWNKPKGYSRTASDFFKASNLKQNLTENIRLGLDLKGGTHLVIQVKVDDVIRDVTSGDRAKAERLDAELQPLHKHLFVEPNPIPVKWALNEMNKIPAGLRLPLVGMEAVHQDVVRSALRTAGAI